MGKYQIVHQCIVFLFLYKFQNSSGVQVHLQGAQKRMGHSGNNFIKEKTILGWDFKMEVLMVLDFLF